MYLARDSECTSGGTHLYSRSPNGIFDIVRQLPFLPNSALIMLRTQDAWHGGVWEENRYRRDTLQIFVDDPNYVK